MLLGAVVIYRLLDGPDFIGVLGPIHGILFLGYFFLVPRIRDSQGWASGARSVCSWLPPFRWEASGPAGTWWRTTGAWAGEVDVAV